MAGSLSSIVPNIPMPPGGGPEVANSEKKGSKKWTINTEEPTPQQEKKVVQTKPAVAAPLQEVITAELVGRRQAVADSGEMNMSGSQDLFKSINEVKDPNAAEEKKQEKTTEGGSHVDLLAKMQTQIGELPVPASSGNNMNSSVNASADWSAAPTDQSFNG